MNRYKIPQKAIRRMSGYYRILRDMESRGEKKLCSRQLGEAMNCAASQVRQDFSFFGNFGTTGQGYALGALRSSVGRVLGADRRNPAILVGVGHIGTYLLESQVFADSGFEIVAAFDISPAVIGREVKGLVVRDSEDIAAYLKENKVTMAALCLPGYSAQAAADLVCAHGVMAIWNVTGDDLELPGGVVLEELSISDSFLSLSYHLAQRRALQEEELLARRKAELRRQREDERYDRNRGLVAMGQGL